MSMKHNLTVTLSLVLLFLIAQMVGLVTVSRYIDIKATSETGITQVYNEKYIIAPPEIEESTSFIYIILAVLFGTGLALLIVRFKKVLLWKAWFFTSVMLCLTLGIFPYVEIVAKWLIGSIATKTLSLLTIAIALAITTWKIFWPNIIIYNLAEIFIYSGIAALLVPVLNLPSVIILLLLISLYDFWAVNKTKHMVTLAKFQTSTKMFAGLVFPYKAQRHVSKPTPNRPILQQVTKQGILGGGDIAFPLLLSGVVLKTTGSFLSAFIVSLFAAASLLVLFLVAKKDKYYPAMPILTLGCLLGVLLTAFI